MNLPKLLFLATLFLFGIIAIAAFFKRDPVPQMEQFTRESIEIELNETVQSTSPAKHQIYEVQSSKKLPHVFVELPDADRIDQLFNKEGLKLPIVETLTYKSRVPWQKGRPAWLSDYASHYRTSRHFIARSLNGKPDYLKQDLAEGDRFNVLRNDIDFEFYLVVDTSRCRMWFYYIDLNENQKTLLKTYPIGLGRLEASKASGLLTPLGKYSLGSRVAIFKPKTNGMHQGKKIEMATVFGTRWIPFEKEIENCTLPAKGFGIHGTPWVYNAQGILQDNTESIGKYESDGCIRLSRDDIEELFGIIISREAKIEIVRDFFESSLHHGFPDAELKVN